MMRRLLSALAVVAALALVPLASQAADPPQTGFEASGGAAWTTHEEELAFLAAVDAATDRVEIEVIGHSEDGKPMHLVRLGVPTPRTPAQARTEPVELHMCTQHGNEAAGRDACLSRLRDLAFTTDAELLQQMRDTTILFIPSANPDGREANQRENSSGVDINRDHLNLTSPEARAIAQVALDYEPEIAVDHHEYGPGTPALYDDEVLYLWPRNLNVDQEVHDLGVEYSKEHLNPCLADAGYTSDEYGIDALGNVDVSQTAGDGDEGIARNLMGLRHTIGILVESGVTQNLLNGPGEVQSAANQQRRVDSHKATIDCTLSWMRENAERAASAQAGSVARKIAEGRDQSAPVYFQGQDEDTTAAGDAPETIADETPACAYDLTAAQAAEMAPIFALQGITTTPRAGGGVRVSMAQAAEPVIPLLLDAQNEDRAATEGEPVDECPAAPAPTRPRPAPSGPAPAPGGPGGNGGGLPATGTSELLWFAAALSVGAGVLLRRRPRHG
jgi:LPXTG-motif cell wall-anchored protein